MNDEQLRASVLIHILVAHVITCRCTVRWDNYETIIQLMQVTEIKCWHQPRFLL